MHRLVGAEQVVPACLQPGSGTRLCWAEQVLLGLAGGACVSAVGLGHLALLG